jgi:hypothetical protein
MAKKRCGKSAGFATLIFNAYYNGARSYRRGVRRGAACKRKMDK